MRDDDFDGGRFGSASATATFDAIPPADDPLDTPPARRRIFVAAPVLVPRRTLLLRLARFYHLDAWDDWLLTCRVGEQMESAAVLLTAIVAFDLFMWTFLFNTIAYTSPWTTGPLTPAAVVLAAILSAPVFIYEKSLITSDLSRKGRIQRAGVYLVRIAFIAVSALATAQPFEVAIFNGQIERRLKEETVNAEALRQFKVQQKESKEAVTTDVAVLEGRVDDRKVGTDQKAADKAAKAADDEFERAKAEVDQARSELATAEGRIAPAVQRLQEAERGGSEEEIQAAGRALASSRGRLASARTNHTTAVSNQSLAATKVDKATAKVKETTTKYDAAVKAEVDADAARARDVSQRVNERKAWLDRVQAATYGDALVHPSGAPLTWNGSDLVDRLHIIQDLLLGKTPLR